MHGVVMCTLNHDSNRREGGTTGLGLHFKSGSCSPQIETSFETALTGHAQGKLKKDMKNIIQNQL